MSYNIYENCPTFSDIQEDVKAGNISLQFSEDDYAVAKYTDQLSFSKNWTNQNMFCRGAIFDLRTGLMVAVGFKKFFNHKEWDSKYCALPPSGIEDCEVLEKLDGSCCLLWQDRNGNVRCSTPGSFTSDQAIWSQNWLKNHSAYAKIKSLFDEGKIRAMTCEMIHTHPDFRIVVQYEEKDIGLWVTSVQSIRDGGNIEYMKYDEMQAFANNVGLNVCRVFNFSQIDEITKMLDGINNFEGVVLRFHNDMPGHLKIKADEYVRQHRIISRIHPNRIEEAIMALKGTGADLPKIIDQIKEVLSHIPEELIYPYAIALERIERDSERIQNEVLLSADLLKERHGNFQGPAFFKNCSTDIFAGRTLVTKGHETQLFSYLRYGKIDSPELVKHIWFKIREEINWERIKTLEE